MADIEIRQGAEVVGSDGPIGRVVHVVVDETTRELDHLVIKRAGQQWLIPAREVARAGGGQVALRGSWAEIEPHATPFTRDEFEPLQPLPAVRAERLDANSADVHRSRTRDETTPLPLAASSSLAREASDTGHLELRQEELLVRKHVREAGAVELRKEVVVERQTLEVPVSHEELIVEHHPVERIPADGPIGEDRTTSLVLHEETVRVTKQPVVTEVVRVRRRAVQSTQHVDETVRREVADVQTEGDAEVTDREP